MLSYTSQLPAIGGAGESTPLSKAACIFLTLPTFQFATVAAASTQAAWLSAIAAGSIFPILELDDEEIKDTEVNLTETPTGRTIKNFEGIRKRLYTITQNLDTHQKLRDYNGSKFRVFIGDMNGSIRGTSPDGTKFEGFKIGYLDIGQQKDGAGYTTPITINFADSSEWDSRGKFFKPTFSLTDLEPITQVEITSQSTVNQSTSVFTFTVAYVDNTQSDSSGVAKNIPISGLLAANIQLAATATPNTPITPETLTETSVPGSYSCTCKTPTAFLAGTGRIIATSANLYQSDKVTLAAP